MNKQWKESVLLTFPPFCSNSCRVSVTLSLYFLSIILFDNWDKQGNIPHLQPRLAFTHTHSKPKVARFSRGAINSSSKLSNIWYKIIRHMFLSKEKGLARYGCTALGLALGMLNRFKDHLTRSGRFKDHLTCSNRLKDHLTHCFKALVLDLSWQLSLADQTCSFYGVSLMCLKPKHVQPHTAMRRFLRWGFKAGPTASLRCINPSSPRSNTSLLEWICNSQNKSKH